LKYRFSLLIFAVMLIATALGTAADLSGRVINGTTKKPAAGDDVVLLTISQEGMTESARATTDRSGHFSLPVADAQASHVVRVVHQGVTYHRIADQAGKALAVEVYDVADRLNGVLAVMDVRRFEATDDTLEIKQLVTIRNDSNPPRTLMNDRPFEIQLPPEAQVQSGLVQLEDGPPLKQKPLAGDQKGQFYFVFPLRPGDTRFAVVYELPYSGEALIEPKIRNPLEQFVIMLPKSMKFEPKAAGIFQLRPDTAPDHVEGTGPVTLGQTLAFRISGTGTLEELQGRRKQAQEGRTVPKERPGGGLGPPIDAPDPLQQYRWQILAGLGVLAVACAAHVVKKTRSSLAERKPTITTQVSTRSQIRTRRSDRHRRRVRVSQ
jgi:hypothetical protein